MQSGAGLQVSPDGRLGSTREEEQAGQHKPERLKKQGQGPPQLGQTPRSIPLLAVSKCECGARELWCWSPSKEWLDLSPISVPWHLHSSISTAFDGRGGNWQSNVCLSNLELVGGNTNFGNWKM